MVLEMACFNVCIASYELRRKVRRDLARPVNVKRNVSTNLVHISTFVSVEYLETNFASKVKGSRQMSNALACHE